MPRAAAKITNQKLGAKQISLFDPKLYIHRLDVAVFKRLSSSAISLKLRFRLIEWLAEAPNRKVKAERKKKISETLDISTRQVERLLDRYNDDRLHETVGIERSDKGQHRVGEYVTLTYDPDHALTLYIYTQATGDRSGEFIGCAHAIDLDTQDLSLDELKQLNKVRSTAKREHSNYDALMALDTRQKLVEERKQEKKARQQAGQKELRGKSKQTSNVVEMRKVRAGKSASNNEPMELLPERVSPEQMKPQPLVALPPAPILEPAASTPRSTERHRLVIAKNQVIISSKSLLK
jgi:hypothetical protein